MSCLFQINICSLVNENDVQIKKFAQKLLNEKYVDFVGSDSHGINYRPPHLESGVNYIYSNCNKEYADKICFKNAEDLLMK